MCMYIWTLFINNNLRNIYLVNNSGGSREGVQGPHLCWVKKEKIHRRKKSRQGKQNKTAPLSSKSGSATGTYSQEVASWTCEERKSGNLVYFTYLLLLVKKIEIQRRCICFSSFCISKLPVTVTVH